MAKELIGNFSKVTQVISSRVHAPTLLGEKKSTKEIVLSSEEVGIRDHVLGRAHPRSGGLRILGQ